MIRIKICGITSAADAAAAAEAGADLIGMIFAESPRRVDLSSAASIARLLARDFPDRGRVGVFVDPSFESLQRASGEARLTHIQIHGVVSAPLPEGVDWIAAVGLACPEDARLPEGEQPWGMLVEPKVAGLAGGTGSVFPWEWARPLLDRTRLFVAGGLDAGQVVDLLETIEPYGVDASSRLETRPGEKDPLKVRAFIEAVRRMERTRGGKR